jgi:hypothetical protein
MSLGAQNLKTGTNILRTTENEFGREKHGNVIQRPLYRRKRVRALNMKIGVESLGTADNELKCAKYEIGNRRTRYHRK